MSKHSQFDSSVFLVLIFVFMQCHLIMCKHQGDIVKRMDIATCLGKFDVKSDMIIKTEESKKMGGKFLDSADALTKVECLHLCCETELCDVFVYEEKGEGECFLFKCGPAQDFRCKFSKHANYTSAIFSIEKKVQPRPLNTLNKANVPTVVLSQNEIDLKNLKGKSVNSVSVKLSSIDAISAVETTTIKAITASMKNATLHCSRFQFQCHSGECIAVYNVCNGIPQCNDASDEGPECQSITRTPEVTQNKASADGRIQLINSNVQTSGNVAIGHNREDPISAPHWPNFNQSPDLNVADAVHQYTDDKAGLQITDTVQQISRLQSDLSRLPATTKDNWNVLNDANIISNWPQQQMPQFPMKPLQFPQKSTYTQYQPDLLQKTVSTKTDQTQLKSQQQYNVNWPNPESNVPSFSNVNHPNHNNEEILPEKDAIGMLKDVPVHDLKKDGKNLIVQNKSESKSTEDSDYINEDEEEITTEPPKKKKKHRKVNKIGKQPTEVKIASKSDSAIQQMKIVHSDLRVEFMDHDGEADRPGGAVVSLALGILITIGLVMVISCRTTAVRKRIRRGKGYAHDADFLVNGLYL